jgi:hypothetical protein
MALLVWIKYSFIGVHLCLSVFVFSMYHTQLQTAIFALVTILRFSVQLRSLHLHSQPHEHFLAIVF